MPEDPREQDDRAFLEICVALNLLAASDSDTLASTITSGSRSVVQTALQRGLLTPADVDIAQSLLHPTEIVPGYRILELIGRGGMGVVYRAEQLDLERVVALKTILISEVSDSTVPVRFEREAKSLAKLHHPNIVQALNFGKHEGRFYFTMEFVSGRTCEQVIQDEGFMPASDVWPIVRQVASGLMHALGQNLIHRDIKPANLILLPPPEGYTAGTESVKIADFGLAIFADHSADQMKLTTGDKILGSPAYMSLEQFGGRQVDFRSDMYSLGATAWHLLFGSPPFVGSSLASLFRQKSEPFEVDPSTLPFILPEDQMRLLVGLLDPSPNQRPQSYTQLIEAIDSLSVMDSGEIKSRRRSPEGAASRRGSISEQPTQQPRISETVPEIASTPPPNPAGAEMSTTVELSRSLSDESTPSPAGRPSRRFTLWIAVSIVIAGLIAVVGMIGFGGAKRGPRSYTRIVGNTPLFDGVTLAGWDVGGGMIGAWNTVEAPDSSTAIACTTRRGALTRRLPATSHLRISLFVWLQPGGGPVDIDFAFDTSKPSAARGCLRLTETVNQLGEKVSDFGDLDVVTQSEALPTVHDRYHVVHLERQPTDWFVFLEERLIGTLPIDRIGDGNALRIVVHGSDTASAVGSVGSQAFFSDFQLYDLAVES